MPEDIAPDAAVTEAVADAPDTVQVYVDNVPWDIPYGIADDDDKIKALLSPLAPGAENSEVKRTRSPQGRVTRIELVKRWGPKSVSAVDAVLAVLRAAPSEFNPAVALHLYLERHPVNSPVEQMRLAPAIASAIQRGEQDVRFTQAVLSALRAANGVPLRGRVIGF